MKDEGIDRILKRVAEDPNFLQTNTDMIREVVRDALARAHNATCPFRYNGAYQCQLPIGHEPPHQTLVMWEDTEESDEKMHPLW